MPLPASISIRTIIKLNTNRFMNMLRHGEFSSTTETLNFLKNLKESKNDCEKKILCYTLLALFKEFRQIEQNLTTYPTTYILQVAHVFGGIIEHNIFIEVAPLYQKYFDYTLNWILVVLNYGTDNIMHKSGITALEHFKHILKYHQPFCKKIAKLSNFQKFPRHIIELVEFGKNQHNLLQYLQTIDSPGTSYDTKPKCNQHFHEEVTFKLNTEPTVEHKIKKIDTSPSIEIVDDAIDKGSKNVQHKIVFILNNISLENLQIQCKNIRKIINIECLPWLSKYLVKNRIIYEYNLHTLYSKLLDYLKMEDLNSSILLETYKNIKVLLKCDPKNIKNSKNILKSLGHWLGLMTIAKDTRISLDQIDLKKILIQSNNDELLFVIPFIAKILGSCAISKVYKPKHPWTKAMLISLAGLHKPELVLCLQFEIECLFKKLNLNLMDFKPLTSNSGSSKLLCPAESPIVTYY